MTFEKKNARHSTVEKKKAVKNKTFSPTAFLLNLRQSSDRFPSNREIQYQFDKENYNG